MTPEPVEVLEVDPRVALWAARWPSSRVEGVSYDVALLSGEPQGFCATCEGADPWNGDLPNGGCVCVRRPPSWTCSCPGFTYRDQCQHVRAAARWLLLHSARVARQRKLDARLGCLHPLTVDEEDMGLTRVARRCVGCDYAYDREPVMERLRDDIRARHRLPASPWSAGERASDTE